MLHVVLKVGLKKASVTTIGRGLNGQRVERRLGDIPPEL